VSKGKKVNSRGELLLIYVSESESSYAALELAMDGWVGRRAYGFGSW
jgi:hypothetical protein